MKTKDKVTLAPIPDGTCELRYTAKDGILSSPLLALAALLAIFSHFNQETVGPQDYNLLTYKPKRKEW